VLLISEAILTVTQDKRTAILVAFVKAFETIALDEAIDVLDLLITEITGDAKRIGQKNRLRTLKDLDKSALALADVCALILNEETPEGKLQPLPILNESDNRLNLVRDRFHPSIMTIKDPLGLTSIRFTTEG